MYNSIKREIYILISNFHIFKRHLWLEILEALFFLFYNAARLRQITLTLVFPSLPISLIRSIPPVSPISVISPLSLPSFRSFSALCGERKTGFLILNICLEPFLLTKQNKQLMEDVFQLYLPLTTSSWMFKAKSLAW